MYETPKLSRKESEVALEEECTGVYRLVQRKEIPANIVKALHYVERKTSHLNNQARRSKG